MDANTTASNKDLYRRFVQIGFLILVQAAVLFLSAGKLAWDAAWVYMGLYLAFIAANAIILLPRQESRGLIAERSRVKADAKDWDRRLGILLSLTGLAVLVVSGLDERFGWTPKMLGYVAWIGALLNVGGNAIFGWAMASNPFFSSVVRIQKDRGHTVATGGPYRIVRHPAYLAQLISSIGIPLLLGSSWALLATVALAVVIVARTTMEDRTLQNELEGYQAYAQRVRYRLLPGLW